MYLDIECPRPAIIGELWALDHEKHNSMRPAFLFGVLLFSACSQAAAIDHNQTISSFGKAVDCIK